MPRIGNLFCFLLVFVSLLPAKNESNTNGEQRRVEIQGTPTATLWNVNRISGWIASDGESGGVPQTSQPGVYYPRFVAPVVYQDGLIWGGYVRDGREPALRVGGAHLPHSPGLADRFARGIAFGCRGVVRDFSRGGHRGAD